ncbi:type II secretion system protein GspL [Pseudomonas aeruginosa]|nr:type II secretion system protein GspL [Pseudomonas aeruginosa]
MSGVSALFLPPASTAGADGELAVWWVQDGECRRAPFAQALAEIRAPWRLYLPVEAVTACAVNLPTQKARWLRQSLPFAVEEQLADDVEQMHLALGPALADGRHRVFAVQRTWLAAWLALAEGAGKAPASLHVDADCLPGEGSCLFWLEERWLLGGSGAVRLACGSEDWPVLRDSCPPPQRAFAAQEVAPLEGVEVQALAGNPHIWLSEQPLGTDLAQAEFAARQQSSQWRRWRPLLGLVGLWLVLQWGFTLVQAWQLQREGDRYAAQSAELYRQLFPEDRKLINLRAQFDQHLADSASSGGEGQLLGLLGQAATVIGGEPTVSVEQLDFSAARGDVALQVRAPGFDVLERLRSRLSESGLAVQLGSASRDGSTVSARLVIGG